MDSKATKHKHPWPTKAAMQQVYENKLWGGDAFDFYSGEGSHQPELVQPYLEAVTSFLKSFDEPLTVCDLGCGDFNIGKQLVPFTQTYVAVDIVAPLIERNKTLFKNEGLTFQCLDIAVDALPKADCVILRQVLQHLSNAEVQCITPKLTNYTYVVVTEHIPAGNFEPNKDIISGQGIRLKAQSGVDLLAAPFCFKTKKHKQLLAIDAPNGKGKIVTTLYVV